MTGAVAHIANYKQGHYYSTDFVGESSWNGYERNCLFLNLDDSDTYAEVARALGADVVLDSRAAVAADIDGNGKLDLVINNNASHPSLLLNALPDDHHWLLIDLQARDGVRDAVGSRVTVSVGDSTMTRWVEVGSGYASQAPYILHFGLGDAERIDEIEIVWPSGNIDRGTIDRVDRRVTVVEGQPIE